MNDIRLLLVDDETDFRQTIAKRLAIRGIVSEEAGTGQECLSILDKKPVDVVVLDVKMPGMNGIEVLDHIKKEHPETEVILLTGHATTQNGVEGIKLGAFDYLIKPVEIEHLIGKIRQAHERIRRGEEIRLSEEKLREAKFRAKMGQQMIAAERLASLGTLAAGVAHEINNPLAIMKESAGWMMLLLKKTELAAMPRKQDFEMALNKIEKSIERVRRITHQLLGAARKSDSALSEVDLRDLVDEAVQLVHREAANKDIEIMQVMDSSAAIIQSYPYQLRQIMINLLTNAIHATGSGGKITIMLEDNGDEVSLTVSDTGEGISEENLERIFEPFFTTKSPGEGTGLGLFVTRGIIEKMGGTIDVESRPGHGSSFRIKMPKSQGMKEGSDENDDVDLLDK
ncbi:MAG: response regulator [Deltaproteobacteria bacterium]|nr:response regulator [Deltaproteobacteria bacterium]